MEITTLAGLEIENIKKLFILLAIYKLNVEFKHVRLTLILLWEKVEGNRMQGR